MINVIFLGGDIDIMDGMGRNMVIGRNRGIGELLSSRGNQLRLSCTRQPRKGTKMDNLQTVPGRRLSIFVPLRGFGSYTPDSLRVRRAEDVVVMYGSVAKFFRWSDNL